MNIYDSRMTMITLRGQEIWALEPKKGPTVLLLHGGLSSSASMLGSIGPQLKKSFRVAAFDRRGHGRSPDNDEPFHYADMAKETIAFIEHLQRRVHLVGHSDGGIVALLVALERPDLLKRVVVIGANYNHRGLLPMPKFSESSPGFNEWAEKYAALSPDGISHAGVVAKKTRYLYAHEPFLHQTDLRAIAVPVLVMAGDDDVATLRHTCQMYEAIPEAQLAIIPGASHGLLKEHTKLSVKLIVDFLKGEIPPVTTAPLRRRAKNS